MPIVSVVVPCYKVEQYLPQMIESLLQQTLRDIQIVLVDDGSPDRSGQICDAYAAKDPRIRVIHKPNGGVAAARNDGLEAATGQWVIFCDSDDYMEPEALEELVRAGESSGADVVFGDVTLVFHDRTEPARFYDKEFVTEDRAVIDRLIQADFYKYYCFDPPKRGPAFGYGGPWNKLVRRELLEEHQIRFDVTVRGIFDDLIYTAHIFAAAKKVAYIHVPVYGYRQLESSITHVYKRDMLQINEAIFAAWGRFMDRYGQDGQFQKPYYANVLRRLRAALGQYFFNEKNGRSFFRQCRELKGLLRSEPYATAIRELEPQKLRYRYDRLLWRAARLRSPVAVWGVYQLYRLMESDVKTKVKALVGRRNQMRLKTMKGDLKYRKTRGNAGCVMHSPDWQPPVEFSLPDRHVFFGYYDLQQLDQRKEKLLVTTVAKKAVTCRDSAFLAWVDVSTGAFHQIAATRAWCWQQGARLRWHPVRQDVVLYNDVEGQRYVCRSLDLKTGQRETLGRAVYDVTPDGRFGLSLNYSRLQRLRPGYGYDALPDDTAAEAVPEDDGIFLVDMDTGTERLVISYRQLTELAPESAEYQNYVNHISIAPDGGRFLFFHLWSLGVGQRWKGRLYVAGLDGSGLRCVEERFVPSHYCWDGSDRLLITSVGFGGAPSYYYSYDLSAQKRKRLPGLERDGHPTVLDGGVILSDTYPQEGSMQELFTTDICGKDITTICQVYSDPRMFDEKRCDLHPRVTADGDTVTFDCTCRQGKRSVMLLRRR